MRDACLSSVLPHLPARPPALLLAAMLPLAALAAPPAHAAPVLLDEAGLRAVHGGLGAPRAQPQAATNPVAGTPLQGVLDSAFAGTTSVLKAPAFASAWAATGAAPLPQAVWDGRDVTQLLVTAPPTSARFELGELFGGVGNAANLGRLGQIGITALDARGSTIWVWSH